MEKKTYKLGIFDYSGVLSDDRRPVYEANQQILIMHGLRSMRFDDWLVSTHASAGEALKSKGVHLSKEEIDELYAKVYKEVTTREQDPVKPVMYPDASEVLAALNGRGLKLAVVSSHPEGSLVEELNNYGIACHFNTISGNPSPKSKRLVDVCHELNVPVSQAFFVEDTIYGLKAGYRAGVDSFGITTGYHSRERLEAEGTALKVVDSLTELLKFV